MHCHWPWPEGISGWSSLTERWPQRRTEAVEERLVLLMDGELPLLSGLHRRRVL